MNAERSGAARAARARREAGPREAEAAISVSSEPDRLAVGTFSAAMRSATGGSPTLGIALAGAIFVGAVAVGIIVAATSLAFLEFPGVGMPTTVFFAADGNEADRHIGLMTEEMFRGTRPRAGRGPRMTRSARLGGGRRGGLARDAQAGQDPPSTSRARHRGTSRATGTEAKACDRDRRASLGRRVGRVSHRSLL